MNRKLIHNFALFIMVLFACHNSYARPVVADLNPRKIEIRHDFQGTEVLVYGAKNDAGTIVTVIRGPQKKYQVREKKRVMGVWMNGDALEFDNVSSFYSMAATGDLSKIKNDNLLRKLGIGIENQKFNAIGKAADKLDVNKFSQYLNNYFVAKNLYNPEDDDISFWGETLFRNVTYFPKNILPGVYNVDVYLFNDGLLTAVQTTPLIVDKVGFEAFIYDFSYRHNYLYGFACVLIAIFFGCAARFLFARH